MCYHINYSRSLIYILKFNIANLIDDVITNHFTMYIFFTHYMRTIVYLNYFKQATIYFFLSLLSYSDISFRMCLRVEVLKEKEGK